MNFIEWMLLVHRAVWFPVNWALGLEGPSIELPAEFAPALFSRAVPPTLRVIKGGRPTRASGAR